MMGMGSICRPPTHTIVRNAIKNATRRMIALVEGAIRQIRHKGLPGRAGSNSNAACELDLRRPQKWVTWAVVDNRTAARHTTARQLAQFACRYRIFTVVYAA